MDGTVEIVGITDGAPLGMLLKVGLLEGVPDGMEDTEGCKLGSVVGS